MVKGGYTPKDKGRMAENYSEKQRKQDRRIYGKRAEKRINKRMLEGEGILSARHAEAVRAARIRKGKQIAKTILSVGAGVAVSIALAKNPQLVKNGFSSVTAFMNDHAIAGMNIADNFKGAVGSLKSKMKDIKLKQSINNAAKKARK